MKSEVIPILKIDIEDMLIEFSDMGVKIDVNEIEQTYKDEIFIIRYEIFINGSHLRRELETEIRKNVRRFGILYSIKEVYKNGEDLLGIYISPKKKYSIKRVTL